MKKKDIINDTRGAIILTLILGLLVGYLYGSNVENFASFEDDEGDIGIESVEQVSIESIAVENPTRDEIFTIFLRTWEVINERFLEHPEEISIDDREKILGAIEGLVESLGDPYTLFLKNQERERFISDIVSGRFEGVGIRIVERDGFIVVVTPFKGTPAQDAGIKADDIIIEINGISTRNLGVEEAVNIIRGEKGSIVTLTIIRDGNREPIEIDVTRGTITIPSIQASAIDDDTFLIEVLSFSNGSFEAFRSALREFVSDDYEYLVVDLRNNPGGLLSSAVKIGSFFVPKNEPVLFQSRDNEVWEPELSRGYRTLRGNIPKTAVLINGGTASSSEILAAALQDAADAILVGERTFGKGSVQQLIEIDDKTSLKVTVGHWRTSDERFISEVGIEPDFEVFDDEDTERDEVLERAVRLLKRN